MKYLIIYFTLFFPILVNAYDSVDEIRNSFNKNGKAFVDKSRPTHKGVSERIDSDINQIKSKGYIEVEKSDAIDKFTINDYSKYFTPLNDIVPNLTFTPATIGNLSLKIEFQGAIPKNEITSGSSKGRWSSLEKFYTLKNKSVLSIEETDYISSNMTVSFQEDFINESVNGNPAIFVIKKTEKGNAISKLTWFSNERLFTIKMTGHVRGLGKANKLVEIAESMY